MSDEIDRDAILTCAGQIAPYIRETPILEVDGLILKLECLQHAGSFKPRGAFTHLLNKDVPEAGLVAASGGNHGAAVAYAASTLGHSARIYVPEISSPAKVSLIRRLGGEVFVGGSEYAEALAASERDQAASGAMTIHAYDQIETVTGQATLGHELDRQADLDTIVVAVGGGGLIAGVASWWRDRAKIVAVEPESSACLNAAHAAGRPIDVTPSGIAADSLGARRIGELPWRVSQRFVDESILVSDSAIEEAQRWCWQSLNLAVEPGGAAALAALRSGVYRAGSNERVGVIICGGNVDLGKLGQVCLSV